MDNHGTLFACGVAGDVLTQASEGDEDYHGGYEEYYRSGYADSEGYGSETDGEELLE